MGSPDAISFVEFGPGKGTLSADILRVSMKFPAFLKALQCGQGVYLIETSPALRLKQVQALGCRKESTTYARAAQTLSGAADDGFDTPVSAHIPLVGGANGVGGHLPVQWVDRLEDIPDTVASSSRPGSRPGPLLLVAHELFDALPFHQLMYRPAEGAAQGAWREVLVDVDLQAVDVAKGARGGAPEVASADETSVGGFRRVLSPSVTPAAAAYEAWMKARGLPPAPPPSLPASPAGNAKFYAEYSPVSCSLAHQIARRVGASGGAALLVDYGYSLDELHAQRRQEAQEGRARQQSGGAADALLTVPKRLPGLGRPTVRGISKHKFVDFLTTPGSCDVTGDVDWDGIRHCALESGNSAVFGPVSQRDWLINLGIGPRLQRLVDAAAGALDAPLFFFFRSPWPIPSRLTLIRFPSLSCLVPSSCFLLLQTMPRGTGSSPRPSAWWTARRRAWAGCSRSWPLCPLQWRRVCRRTRRRRSRRVQQRQRTHPHRTLPLPPHSRLRALNKLPYSFSPSSS
jgi:NADH dehydrogenase [ubiquinone] 1 alpha subcomplex assembly factor 7